MSRGWAAQVREKLALKAVATARLAGRKHDASQRLPRRYAQLKDLDACAPPLCPDDRLCM